MHIFTHADLEMMLRILVALILGATVGFERQYFGKSAGLRTYALVSLGAALFTVVSLYGVNQLVGFSGSDLNGSFRYNYDPTRIVSQIVVGIGFLGAGLIIFRGFKVEGLTTAAGLWVTAAIGTAAGFGFYAVAVVAAVFALIVFYVFKRVEPQEHHFEDDKGPGGLHL